MAARLAVGVGIKDGKTEIYMGEKKILKIINE